MSERDQLEIPAAAKQDPTSFELVRVWIANKNQHVALSSGVWEDPAAWGIMLADLAKHVARSYFLENRYDETKTLQRIKAGLDAEWESPTDSVSTKPA